MDHREQRLLELKLEKLQRLQEDHELREGLPHLHGMPWYEWAWKFFTSTNRQNFICAANQISKSSTQIRKCIDWATDKSKWPKLWRMRPTQFWYLYPSKTVATTEFYEKWEIEWLPRGKYKDHPDYGWKEEIKNKEVHAIHFNSGVSIYFKSYGQDAADLQSGSVHAMFFDEELPVELWDELNLRLEATDGYMHGVFTATKGQEFWRQVIEETGVYERLPDAFKQQVSMYDCLTYIDGTNSHWTVPKIKRVEANCKSDAEVQRRVWGKFVADTGLKYPSFSEKNNVKKSHPVPKSWHIYAGVDIGSGGEDGHPSAIVFVAVDPDYKQGRVFKGWRGDGIPTTAGDVLRKFQEMRGRMVCSGQYYDWACKDFETIAQRNGESFLPADKSHESGEQILNVLFKNGMLAIYDLPELEGLVSEIKSLKKDTKKNKARDDFADALRYAVTKIAWDFSVVGMNLPPEEKPVVIPHDFRGAERGLTPQDVEEQAAILAADVEFEEINELYGT